jgi:hypothetical protein
MKHLIAMMSIACLFGAGAAFAEKKVKLQDAPSAVQATVKEQTKTAPLVGLSQEVENGKTVYELETKVNGRTRDLMIDASGAVISVEEEVALDSIPAGAKAAIEKQAAGGEVTRVETVTKGKVVTYEAGLLKKGKKSEFTVAADGSPVK